MATKKTKKNSLGAVLLISALVVIVAVYLVVLYKRAGKPGSPIPPTAQVAPTSTLTITTPISVENVFDIFSTLKTNSLPLVDPSKIAHGNRVISIYSSKDDVPYITELLTPIEQWNDQKDHEFYVMHQLATESSIRWYGPFSGSISDLASEIKQLKSGDKIGERYVVTSVDVPEDASKSNFQGVIRVEHNSDGSKFFIKKDGQIIKELDAFQGEGPVDYVAVFRSTPNYVYIGRYFEPNGDYYTVYENKPIEVYRLRLSDNNWRDISKSASFVQAVSVDDALIAYEERAQEKLQIAVRKVSDNTEKSFTVPLPYQQIGQVYFSLDSKKVVYSASTGEKGNQQGAVIVIDLEKGTQAIVEKTAKPNAYFKVSGWKDAATIDYELVVL
jgi:hypothetical protein